MVEAPVFRQLDLHQPQAPRTAHLASEGAYDAIQELP